MSRIKDVLICLVLLLVGLAGVFSQSQVYRILGLIVLLVFGWHVFDVLLRRR